jgi:hypothetical protein
MAAGNIFIGTGIGAFNVPVITTITPTANQVNVINGAGSIRLSTPQDIATTSSPTFASMTLNSLAATSSLALTTTSGSSNFTRNALGTHMQDAAPGNSYVRISGNTVTTAFVTLDDGFGTITGLQLQSTGITANMPVKSNGAKVLISGLIDLTTDITHVLPISHGGSGALATMTDGQLLIGRTGLVPSNHTNRHGQSCHCREHIGGYHIVNTTRHRYHSITTIRWHEH